MHWLQLRICSPPENAAAIEAACEASGALAVCYEDNANQAIFEPPLGESPLWQNTRVTALFAATIDTTKKKREILSQLQYAPEASWHTLEDKDWALEWMTNFQAMECAPNLWICPSWIDPPNKDACNIILDPGLAFGTGTHPSTFLCLSWLAKQQMVGKQLVDYGCGSGILGLASLLLGAKIAYGVDIDPQALQATQENTRRNKLDAARFPVCKPEKCPNIEADILVANILAGPLVELEKTLGKLLKPGGLLCLAGILANQQSIIEEKYQQNFSILEVNQKDEWICISAMKK